MFKQCLDFLLNLNDEQLVALKQRVLELLEQRRQKQICGPDVAASAVIAAGGGGAGQSPEQSRDGKAETEALHSPPQHSADGHEAEEPWGPERLLQNCPEADVVLIPKQLEALQRLRSPLDRQTEVRRLLRCLEFRV